MECHRCATPIPENSRFCLSCGADVSGEGHERTLAVDGGQELMRQLQVELGDEYQLERELGRGGMAIVYLGHDTRLGRKVAVKVLPPDLGLLAGQQIIERFKREARTSATLDHPNIIPVHRVSPGGKLFWYVMKYLEGEPLDKLLQREGQLAADQAIDIVRQVAEALDFAHQHQVVHRDIKPANVVLDPRGRVTVTDFGIAKALDANRLTASGSMIGTPYYMSPEQCAGRKVGPAADQYSLAVMTYQMLGGHLPFTGESVVDIIRKHVMDPVPPLGVLRPSMPSAAVKVIERGLAKQAEQRFPSCAEFGRALASVIEGRAVPAAPRPYSSGQRLSRTALVSPVPGVIRRMLSDWPPAGKVGVGLAVVFVAAMAGVAVRRAMVGSAPEPASQPLALVPTSPAPVTRTDSAGPALAAESSAAPSPPPVAAAPAPRRPRGSTERRSVTPAPSAGSPAAPTTARATPSAPPTRAPEIAPSQLVPQPATPPSSPAPGAAAPTAVTRSVPDSGLLSITSTPATASITINGQRAPRNPAMNRPVAAGRVEVVFTWTDAAGSTRSKTVWVDVPAGRHIRYQPAVALESP